MKRKFLFSILLFLAFVSVSVYVIVTAQGSRIDGEGNVVTTSILRVNSVPSDVTVYINDAIVSENGNRVEWLTPGTVKVTLKKAGYRTWEKSVDLKAGIIEDIYAQLYPERLNFDKLTSVNVDKFFFSNDTDYVFYTVVNGENANDNGLWKLKLRRNLLDIGDLVPAKVYSFTADELLKLQKNPYNLLISNDNSKVVLDLPQLAEVYYIDLNNPVSVSLKNTLSFYPEQLQWLGNSNNLIASNGNVLVSYDVNSKNQTLIYYSADKPIIYAVSGEELYYYRYDSKEIYNIVSSQSTAIKLSELYKGTGIEKIITPKDNTGIIYTLEGTTLNFVDLNKSIILPFLNVQKILAVSQSGTGLTYIDTNNKVETLVFKPAIDLKSYTFNNYSTTLDPTTITKIFYSQTEKSVIVLATNKDGTKVVLTMDDDGLNLTQLISDEKIVSDNVAIDSTGLGLYLLLQDNSASIQNATVNNIYKYNLQVN